jgi:predicted nucleic-acid-binding protein
MTALPDTNVILRYLLEDNPAQSATAAELFENVRTGKEKALILESVLVECVYILCKYYNVPRVDTALRLTSLLNYRGITNPDAAELIRALSLFARGTLDIVDCILRAKADDGPYRLISFDEKLRKSR